MKFIMAGGGTAGHIIPALAVAEELRGRGHEPIFIGTRHGMEARLVPKANFPIEWIEIGGLNRVGLAQRLKTLWQLPLSTINVLGVLERYRAAAVFSMGGYVAGPVVLAALLKRVPVVVMEPNAIPGLTNRKLARFTSRALVNFEETAHYFPEGRAEVTGVPVRREFFTTPQKTSDGRFTLLITGGSQGSRTLNIAASAAWERFARAGAPIRILHQAGRGNAEPLQEVFRQTGMSGEIVDFIDNMPAAFAQADLIVCRSGASTVSELAAAGRPSILVPFPYAADDHQQYNADAMERVGAARVVTDRELTGKRLFEEVTRLMMDRPTLEAMGQSAKRLAKPYAAQEAADALLELVR
ncbi:MAG TPA: undecaprenyldiphospho-muramoylpentapeptide beta-N-acetylglucosaminyltransferase [Bryobacteraceae bacterium]|nr:undecaprenyldiphospho-muramoylpentapeptide beta-N-acetylglucosaminyltransferase [Bryobacteraceae bacterium]